MFVLRVFLLDERGRNLKEERGFISSESDDLLSDFHVAVRTGSARSVHGKLLSSPRWAEPVLGFVGRCLATIDELDTLPTTCSPQSLRFSVVDARRGMRDVAMLNVLGLKAGNPGEFQGVQAPWARVRDMCLQEAYGDMLAAGAPSPLEVKVHMHGGSRYCRLSELPADARFAASWVTPAEARVAVPGLRDAVTPEYLESFLCNRAEVPRPFQGWLWP